MLSEKQYKLIELLVSGDYTVTEALKEVQIGKSTYYEWRKGQSKPGKEFNKAYDEALELKVKESRKYVRSRVNELLSSLVDITENGKNENAKVNAVAKLLNYAELDPQFKQELTIKGQDNDKNELLERWKEKQQQGKDDQENEE